MRNSALILSSVLIVGLSSLVPAVASAQPRGGQVAVGADIGLFLPADDQLSSGLMADGLVEFYATRRIGIRGIVTAIRNGYDRPDDDDERQLRLGGDVIYNWEGGNIHPFAGAGLAVHFLRFYRDGDNQGPNDTKFGANVLGGVELFVNSDWTVKLEGRYQWVEDRPNLNPDGLGLLVGVKRYF